MPNRILREGINTSERIDQLGWPAEVFYRRLMSVVDDFGRYYAKPELLLSACYPLRVTKVRLADIATWIGATCEAGLVRTYRVDGKDYLELLDFRQQVRAKESKYPSPATQTHSTRVATAHLDGDEVEVGDVEPLARSANASSLAVPINGEAVAYIPIVGGVEFGVSKALLAELEAAYPMVDGPGTLKEIRAWCITNPGKRKTARGVPRFLNSWFERLQNRG